MPPLVYYCLRFYCPDSYLHISQHNLRETSFIEYYLSALTIYFIWAISYYIKIFVASWARIDKLQYENVYKYVL
jgi:hypothetical protein